eukprot:scaffold1381_cov64-Cylindrotheca_fusiformis.AAC.12
MEIDGDVDVLFLCCNDDHVTLQGRKNKRGPFPTELEHTPSYVIILLASNGQRSDDAGVWLFAHELQWRLSVIII